MQAPRDSREQGRGAEPSRRDFLRRLGAGGALGLGLGGLGLSRVMADPRASSPRQPAPTARAQGVIHIYLPGGLAAQESFDPKPYAPIEYRGEIGSLKTRITGARFSQLLPKTASIADRITVCRSMTHGEADHDRGTHNMFTGYRPSPAIIYPSLGSVVSQRFGVRNKLPPYVCIPNQPNNFAGSGYLSSAMAPFSLGSDPARGNFAVRDLNLPKGVDGARQRRRRALLDTVNEVFTGAHRSSGLEAMDSFYERAFALIDSAKAREAFQLKKEPKKLRDEYGRNQAGQRMLLARRLIESGVRFVALSYGGWDMHDRITANVKRQLPPFDQAFAALIRDLERRDMLSSTLVMVTTEFGRTPKLNKNGGRDHWPKVFSIVLAGGGVRRGFIYGATDATATEPEEDALTVEDWAATVYTLLGVDPDMKLLAPGNRPIPLVKDGRVRKELLA